MAYARREIPKWPDMGDVRPGTRKKSKQTKQKDRMSHTHTHTLTDNGMKVGFLLDLRPQKSHTHRRTRTHDSDTNTAEGYLCHARCTPSRPFIHFFLRRFSHCNSSLRCHFGARILHTACVPASWYGRRRRHRCVRVCLIGNCQLQCTCRRTTRKSQHKKLGWKYIHFKKGKKTGFRFFLSRASERARSKLCWSCAFWIASQLASRKPAAIKHILCGCAISRPLSYLCDSVFAVAPCSLFNKAFQNGAQKMGAEPGWASVYAVREFSKSGNWISIKWNGCYDETTLSFRIHLDNEFKIFRIYDVCPTRRATGKSGKTCKKKKQNTARLTSHSPLRLH